MKLLFEGYKYADSSDAYRIAREDHFLDDKGLVSVVGYYYSKQLRDTVIILPKVFLMKMPTRELKAFGRHAPESLFNYPEGLEDDERRSVFEMSTLLYRAINRYKKSVVSSALGENLDIFPASSGPRKEKDEKTYLEIILALYDFYLKNRGLITFITRYNNSGNSNIQWDKTISSGQVFLQGGEPIYLDFVTRERAINLDEEIIVLLLSTLRWLKQEGFFFEVNCPFNYRLIPPSKIKVLLNGGGVKYLNRIRHKYFNDTLVSLWKLLYLFYHKSERIARGTYEEEALVISKFNNVFEDMVDSIITDQALFDENTPFKVFKSMRIQKDGKRVDHLYHDCSLFGQGEIIFVGDSKYYRDDKDIDDKSVDKQYTYAKNVIQVNIDHKIENNRWLDIQGKVLRYRDSATEGYDFTPNFFIRSSIDFGRDLDLKKPGVLLHNSSTFEFEGKKHFGNRLFDRDTLFLLTIDVNFMYVLQYYARGRKNEMLTESFRNTIREAIVGKLRELYDFYLITITDDSFKLLHPSGKASYIMSFFPECRGRMFRPDEESEIIILALEKGNIENLDILASVDRQRCCSFRQDAELTDTCGVIARSGR